MKIFSPNDAYRIPTQLLTALSEGSASKNNDSTFSLKSSASTPMISTSTTTAALQASLAATKLDNADPSLSSSVAGCLNPALSYALSHGGVNPFDWLAKSDVKLFEQTTGGTIKDGVIYDKDGKVSTDRATGDFAFSLYCMRNFGTYSASDGQPQPIKGDITADDIRNFIGYYQSRHSKAFNFDILEKALDVLTAKEADGNQSSVKKRV